MPLVSSGVLDCCLVHDASYLAVAVHWADAFVSAVASFVGDVLVLCLSLPLNMVVVGFDYCGHIRHTCT